MNPDIIDTQKLWHDALNIIKVSISQANFSTWFSKTYIVKIDELNEGRQAVEIACPSSFIADGLEKRYFSLIQDALDQTTAKKNDISFIVSQITSPSAKNDFVAPLFAENEDSQSVSNLPELLRRARVRPGFTFDNFAVSGTNQMAWAAADAVAKNLGTSYNPLFLWGGVGVGKTHLMLAIATQVLSKNPDLSVLYCMGEEFTSEIVDAIRNKSTQAFKKKYRNLDLLMVDDVQFIAGKNAVQEEFFHTFNTLLREGGQIVLTSDRPPSEIQKLEERIRSRFEAGLIIDISPPDVELRSAIALIKAEERGLIFSMDVASLIASHIEGLRRIEGFITRVWTEVQGDSEKVTVDLVNKLLNLGRENREGESNVVKRAIIPQDVVDAVANYFSLGRRKLLGEGRARPIAVPRQVLMYLLRVELGLPLQEVGHIVGGRDHTTVMHAVDKISKNISTDPSLRDDIMGIKKVISGQM